MESGGPQIRSRSIADIGGYQHTLDAVRLHLKHSDLALEFGCGTGTTALHLAASVERIIATDLSREMVAIAREKAATQGAQNVSFQVGAFAGRRGPTPPLMSLWRSMFCTLWRRCRTHCALRIACCGGWSLHLENAVLETHAPAIRAVVPVMRFVGQAPTAVAFFTADELETAFVTAGLEVRNAVGTRHAAAKTHVCFLWRGSRMSRAPPPRLTGSTNKAP